MYQFEEDFCPLRLHFNFISFEEFFQFKLSQQLAKLTLSFLLKTLFSLMVPVKPRKNLNYVQILVLFIYQTKEKLYKTSKTSISPQQSLVGSRDQQDPCH